MSLVSTRESSVTLQILAKMRRPKVGLPLLGLAVVMAISSVVAANFTTSGWAIILGNIGTVAVPVLLAGWAIADGWAHHQEEGQRNHRELLRVKGALKPLGQQLQAIAETPQQEWTPNRVRQQREGILEVVRQLVSEAGVHEPRVCLYKVSMDASNTDAEGNQALSRPPGKTVDELSYVAHRGEPKPKDLYLKTTHADGEVLYASRRNRDISRPVPESGCEGLFTPVETRNPSHEGSRAGYSMENHSWRASARFPVLAGPDVEHILTIDTTVEHGVSAENNETMAIGAALLRLLASVVDEELPNRGINQQIRKRFAGGEA